MLGHQNSFTASLRSFGTLSLFKMGQVISALRVSVKEADRGAEEKAKQDLDILQTLVDSKLDQFQAEVNAQVNEYGLL